MFFSRIYTEIYCKARNPRFLTVAITIYVVMLENLANFSTTIIPDSYYLYAFLPSYSLCPEIPGILGILG